MSLVGFKGQNHPLRPAVDEVDDRRTPAALFDELHAEHDFTLDAAASPENAKLDRFCSLERDGLAASWRGESVWCNPPFSKLAPWLAKAWSEMLDNDCRKVVMLLPANRCEQGWWHEHVEPYRDRQPSRGGGTALGVVCERADEVRLSSRAAATNIASVRLRHSHVGAI